MAYSVELIPSRIEKRFGGLLHLPTKPYTQGQAGEALLSVQVGMCLLGLQLAQRVNLLPTTTVHKHFHINHIRYYSIPSRSMLSCEGSGSLDKASAFECCEVFRYLCVCTLRISKWRALRNSMGESI